MKQLWQDYNRVIILAAITIPLMIAALIWVTDKPADPIRLTVPDASEVTVCYYIPDVTKPYEQVWLGGEELEAALGALAELEFSEAEEPNEGKMVACLVVATNEEQITVHVDEEGRAWVFYEGRWLCEKDYSHIYPQANLWLRSPCLEKHYRGKSGSCRREVRIFLGNGGRRNDSGKHRAGASGVVRQVGRVGKRGESLNGR